MHGKRIKSFKQEGELRDDSDIPRLRKELEHLLVEQMRAEGYLPVHDLRISWSTKWLGNKYSFILTIYGAFAGKKKAREFDLWSDWRLVKIS